MIKTFKKLDLYETRDKNADAYKIIFELENKIRLIILHLMNNKNKKWWEDLNGKYIDRVEKMKSEDDVYMVEALSRIRKNISDEVEDKYKNIILTHDIYYTNLKDLYFIIKRYWNDIFSKFFNDQDIKEFYWKLDRANTIRNKIMHSKPITKIETSFIDNFKSYINEQINIAQIDTQTLQLHLSLSNLIDEITDEVNNNLLLTENGKYDKLLSTHIIDYYRGEWWWNSSIFEEYKHSLDNYYEVVMIVNEKIKSLLNYTGNIFEIDNAIQDSNIVRISNKLLSEINVEN